MSGKEQTLPLQDRPLHAFCIKNGKLEHKTFERYGITPSRHGNIYRFVDAALKTKTENQLDKALNGYVYTFDPDPRHALEIFRGRAESDMTKARAALQSACSDMDEAMKALENLEKQAWQE